MNMSDSSRVKRVLEDMGYTWTDEEKEANLLGVLACSVRQKAIDKVYGRIHKWNTLKNRKNLLTFVSGCILPADKEKFLKLFDLVFHMSELSQLPELIGQYGVVTTASMLESNKNLMKSLNNLNEFWDITPKYDSTFEAYVPIQNGCDKFCTFCAVPYTRGREVSRPSSEIVEEVSQLVEKGYKSITLLGQNVNSYGLDKKGQEKSFAGLLKEIGELGNKSGRDFWVYFTSPHPRDMEEEVFKVMTEYDCLAKQVHLPVQSGDDKLLIKMNRNHSMDRYRQVVAQINKHLPNATLFTDIIVGFTGETDEQFQNTVKIMAEFKYNMAYIAMYSPRPGAVSSRWQDDIPKDVKKERLHFLSAELQKYASEHTNKLKGKTQKVLVTRVDKDGYLSGYNEGKIIVRFDSGDASLIGSFVTVKIESVTPFSVQGELVGSTKEELTGV